MAATMKVDIVSAEESLYSGEVQCCLHQLLLVK